MTPLIRAIIALAIWLLYSLVAYQGCIKPTCCGEATEELSISGDATLTQQTPVAFRWDQATPSTNEGFNDWRQNLIAQLKDNDILEITGLYYDEEAKPEDFETMGFARADQIKKILAPDIPEDRIRIRSRAFADIPDGVRDGFFEGVAFNWIKPEETIEKTVETVEEIGESEGVEEGGLSAVTIIHFPFGSSVKEYDPAVDEYLDKLATRIKESGERVSLVGHTDDVGEPEANLTLGRDRALGVQRILTAKGVNAGQITIDSKGEQQPTDTNTTEEGRYNNRRVVVRILK